MSTFHIENLNGIAIKGHTLEVGDARISINGSPFVNLTNLPVARRSDSIIFDLDLTAAEQVVGSEIRIEDQGEPAWLPLSITIDESNVPTADENAQAIESRLANGGDGIDLPQIFADAFEAALANEADGNMTSANVLQGAVTAALTAYNASTGPQVNAVVTAIGLLPTLTAILQNPTIIQLVANAETAASNGGGTGNGDGLTVQEISDQLERIGGPLDSTFKSGDTIRHTDSETGTVQATVIQTKV